MLLAIKFQDLQTLQILAMAPGPATKAYEATKHKSFGRSYDHWLLSYDFCLSQSYSTCSLAHLFTQTPRMLVSLLTNAKLSKYASKEYA